MKKQFCPKGHDTHIVGRVSNGRCAQCNRDNVRRVYWNLSPEARRARNAARAADTAAVRAILRGERR